MEVILKLGFVLLVIWIISGLITKRKVEKETTLSEETFTEDDISITVRQGLTEDTSDEGIA